MQEVLLNETLDKLKFAFDNEKSNKIQLSVLIDKYGFKLIDVTILFTCLIDNNEFAVDDIEKLSDSISDYIEGNKKYKIYNLSIFKVGGDEDGT